MKFEHIYLNAFRAFVTLVQILITQSSNLSKPSENLGS